MPSYRGRIAIVTQDPANYGGVLRLVEYIYNRSESLGLEPTILHYARFAEHPELNASLANLTRGELNLWPSLKRYEFQGMNAIAIGAYLPEWEPNRIRANRLWRKTLNDFDRFILVTGSAHTGLPLAQLQKPFAAWVSSTVDTDRRERLKHERGFTAFLERLGLTSVKNAERQVLNTASQLLAVSQDAKHHIDQIGLNTSEVWPFPIDTTNFQPTQREFGNSLPTFLFVGRSNDPRKRFSLFLNACIELHRSKPDTPFVACVVSRHVPNAAVNLPFVKHVHSLSEDELIALYQSSTALVLTSEQEGLGIAAMEAMACGLPVISTRCGGPETFIEDNVTGFFVNDNPKEIARRMFELASDRTLFERMSVASRGRIEQGFSEHHWNEKFDRMLLTL